MAEDEPLMALTADVVFPSEDDLFLGHEADFPVEDERDGDNIFTRPLKEAVQLAFLRTLGSLGLTPEEEQLVREASDNDLTGAYSGDELGNLTLKETVHIGFQNALNVLKGLKLSQESISEASQEVDRIEHELFPLQEIEKLPFGHAVALAFDHCETAANEMIEFFGQLRSTNTVSLLKVMDTLMPKQLEQGKKQCEAIKATLLAVKTVAQPIILIANEGSSCVGQNIPESSNRARNGYDSLLKILLQLLVGLTQTLRITLGLQNKYLDMIWWSNYSSQLDQHLRQLRRAYGIVYTSCKIARLINPSESLFVSGNPAELEPDETKKSINTAGMFGRHFGFHYPQEVRNILQVINIVRESSSSAVAASPGARNVAFLAYFVLYGNMVVLNELGLDIKKAASIGADEQNVQTIENARLYLNVVDEPLLVAGSNIISPDPFIDKGFLVDRDDAEQVALRLISFMDRPHHVASLMHPENWVERRVSSLLTKEAKDSIERLSEKIDVYLRPGAHTLARTLIFHLHGGGFIGQSSKSHGSYIRHWAANIQDSIIISVDYKLAPEYKYVVSKFVFSTFPSFGFLTAFVN
uniref:Hormone-sensitive lipase n=1 Tax=Rhodosorus marinus TaxID=101924 RepID=A0A7S2ZVF5_9RHOD|mmetsp:Transcript_33244/g.130847  ORF Transcript_33244/g.130847 Transcript_33244/m.130847 type:complete len:582 (+) Transcript_33244:767-2512(+)